MEAIEALDEDLRAAVSVAYARFREKTDPNNGWVEPPEYVPRPPPYRPAASMRTVISSVEEAFDWVVQANEFLERARPPATEKQILSVWAQYSHHLYYHDDGHFPLEDIYPLKLSVLLLHDVFNLAQKYITARQTKRVQRCVSSEDAFCDALDTVREAHQKTNTPWGMVKTLAKKFADHIKSAQFRKDKAVHYLSGLSIYIRNLSPQDVARKRDAVVAEAYPRVYL